MIQNRVKLYVRHFYRFCRSTIIDHETRERQLYVIVGNGQSRLRSLTVSKRRRCWPWDSDDGCTLYINLLTKEVQVMHVQSRKCLFLEKNVLSANPLYFYPSRSLYRSLHETPYNDYHHYMTCILNLVNVSLV